MPSVKVYHIPEGKTETMELPEAIFGVPANKDLLHQAVVTYQGNARRGTAHTKTRGAVAGGGRKPWRQKGTGRARHGSRRSPIWRGGGITFGPTVARNWSRELPAAMRKKALSVALSAKARDGELVVVKGIGVETGKTREAARMLKGIGEAAGTKVLGEKGGRTLVVIGAKNELFQRATRNLPYVAATHAANLNANDVLLYKYLVVSEDALPALEKRLSS